MKKQDYDITTLCNRLERAVSPFHVVSQCEEELQQAGYVKLDMNEPWELQEQQGYYINHHGSTFIAFRVPNQNDLLTTDQQGNSRIEPVMRIGACHTDYPCLRIKSNPDIKTEGYGRINTEVYGGAILNTWMDRPLGVAGKVAIKSKQPFAPIIRLFDSKTPIMTIPNLAIHMNRDVNKGQELNKQTDMIPLLSSPEEESDFMEYLAQELEVDKEAILDFELTVYVSETPEALGISKNILSSPRIDNISSVEALMEAMLHVMQEPEVHHLNIAVCFDHEEIGSRSKQGAQSALLTDVIAKIYGAMDHSCQQAKNAIYQGMMLSVDVAHALHPNHPEKEDVTNKPVLNAGVCIKEASAQSYATDCEAVAIVEQIAQNQDVTYQKFANRSDMPGGGTLGALSQALLPMKTVDIGIPILAMHSARETMGIMDMQSLKKMVLSFYME